MVLPNRLSFVYLALLPWCVLPAQPSGERADSAGNSGGSGPFMPFVLSELRLSDDLSVARNDSESQPAATESVPAAQEPTPAPEPADTGVSRDPDLGSVLKQPWEFLYRPRSDLTFHLPEVVAAKEVTCDGQPADRSRVTRLAAPAAALTPPAPLAGSELPGGSRAARPRLPDFDYAEWVRRKDMAAFESYLRERQTGSEGGDIGRLQGKDVEFIYEIYLKGHLSPYLDTSEQWSADVLGGLIEHVDGVSRLIKAIQDSFLTNNLFRPSNPFRKFADGMVGQRPRPGEPQPFQVPRLSGPAWEWKGDLRVRGTSLFEGLGLDEVTLEVGRLKLSERVEIMFDLFYLDD